jgi:hypothetical protein
MPEAIALPRTEGRSIASLACAGAEGVAGKRKVHRRNGPQMKSLALVALLAAMSIWGLASIPAQNAPSKPPRVEVRIITRYQHEAGGRVSYEEVAPVPHSSGRESVFAYSTR